MDLFDFMGSSKEDTLNLAKKTKKKVSTKKGNTLDDAITKVRENLGKYKDNYTYITSLEELKNTIDKVIEDKSVAIDTETSGLNTLQCEIAGISLYSKSIKPCYIPLTHRSFYTKVKYENQLEISKVKEQFERLKDINIIWHNARFDLKVFHNLVGIDLPIYWDTMIGAHLLNEAEEHGLKYLYHKYVEQKDDDEFFKFSDLFDKNNFQDIPIDVAYIYASHDAYMTYKLYEYQVEEYKKEENTQTLDLLTRIEFPIIQTAVDMELRGIMFDKEYCANLKEEYEKELEDAKKEFYKEISVYQKEINSYMLKHPDKLDNPINYSSPTQIAILLYDIIKVPSVEKKTSRGTGAPILEKLKDDYPLCDKLLACKKLEKLITAFIDALPEKVEKDGAIHCSFNTCGTETGRFSSSDPK